MTLTYERRGSGPPLVLLHGLGHRWQGWSPVLPLLAAEHEVIAVDLPGFGASPPTAGTRWREDLVPAVAGFLAELDLDRPHVAGNSLGGVIALELAIAGSVSSATALAPAGFWLPRERRWARGLMGVLRAATFLPAPLLRSMAGSARMRNLSYGALVGRPANLAPAAMLEDAMALRASPAYTTIARGTRDRILPYRQALRAREQLPGARHVDLPGCGHVPMSDDPELVASVILQTTKGTASS
jgi:pimeloyl-ACP methyl ester carboxylesterase